MPDTQAKLVLAGGMSGTEGIIHSGLGPFDILRGSTLKYGRLSYTRGQATLRAFVNALDAEAPLLLLAGLDGRPLNAHRRKSGLRRRVLRPARSAQPAPDLVRRQLPAQQLQHLDGATRRQPGRGRRLHPGHDLPLAAFPMGRGHAVRSVRRAGPRRRVAADRVAGEAAAEPDHPFLLQPGVPGALLHQQLSRDRLSHRGRSRRRPGSSPFRR